MPRSAAKSEKCRGSLVSAPAPEAPSVEPVVDIIPTRLTGDAWLAVLAQEEGEEVVTEIIQQLESTVLDKCCQVYLQKQLIPFTVCWAREAMVETMEWQFLVRDEGDDEPENSPLWEEEPEPCTIDAWAQGCVPVCSTNSYTPFLQKLLELHSAELSDFWSVDSQGKSQSSVEQEISEETNLTDTTVMGRAEHGQTERRESGDVQSLPCPHAPAKTTRLKKQIRKTLPTDRITQGPTPAEQDQQVSILPQPRKYQTKHTLIAKRLDPTKLSKHQVWPEIEVLEPQPPKRFSGITGMLASLVHTNQDHCKPTRQVTFTPQADYKRLSTPQKKSSIHALQHISLKVSHQRRSPLPGITPFSNGLPLHTMQLARGVALRDIAVRNPHTEAPPQPELKPIKDSLPPLLSLDKVLAGQGPRVTSKT